MQLKKRYIAIPVVVYGLYYYGKLKLQKELFSTNYEANISRRYKHFKQDSQYTINQLISMLVIEEIDLDMYLQSLSQFKNSQQVLIDGTYVEKLEAWKLFKSKCIEKLFIKIYITCALNLLIHIQMNIIGKYTYLQSVGELNHNDCVFMTKKIQSEFLEASKYVYSQGWKNLNLKKAMGYVDAIELNQAISLKDINKLVHCIREEVEVNCDIGHFKNVVLSPSTTSTTSTSSSTSTSKLYSELLDIVDRFIVFI